MEDKKNRVLLCEDSTQGILSAVYEAYMSRYGHKYITIETEKNYEPSFFTETFFVPVDIKHAESVASAVIEKISPKAWHWVRMASLAGEPGKAQAVYRFLNLGFHEGASVCSRLSDDHVLTVFKLMRRVTRESEKLKGFVRFHELSSGILYASIAPKHQQLHILGEHFADRLPEENWVIYDENRRMACIHRAHGPYAVMGNLEVNPPVIADLSESEREFACWWKTFFTHIEIRERRNPGLQMNMMPKRFWSNIDEMKV